MLYSKADVLAFAIATVAVERNICSLTINGRSGAARNFEWGTKRQKDRVNVEKNPTSTKK